ncbi:MAG: PAS domain-containing protein, partial [Gammaproteobacteria bacterium]
EDRERVRQISEAAIAAGESFVQEYRAVMPDGSVRNLLARTEVFCDEDGRAIRLAGTLQDVTARVAPEREGDAADSR